MWLFISASNNIKPLFYNIAQNNLKTIYLINALTVGTIDYINMNDANYTPQFKNDEDGNGGGCGRSRGVEEQGGGGVNQDNEKAVKSRVLGL